MGRGYRIWKISLGALGGAALGFVFGALAGLGVGFVHIVVIHLIQARPTTPQIEDYSPLVPYLCALVAAPIGAVALAVGGAVRSWIATAPEDRAARYRAAARRWLFIRTPVIVLVVAGWITGAWVFAWVQGTRFDPYRLRNDWDLQAPRPAALGTFAAFTVAAVSWGIWARRREHSLKQDAAP
jgi:hypothetical protein